MLVACGGVTAQEHAENAGDAATYQEAVIMCGIKHKGDCPAYLACKCDEDKKHNFDSGACQGRFEDGRTC